jgi:hypothetical protein
MDLPKRTALDIGCVYEEPAGTRDQKTQEIEGKNAGQGLRGHRSQNLPSPQIRDWRQAERVLDRRLQVDVGQTLSSNGRGQQKHALKVYQFAIVKRERPLVNAANGVLASIVRVRSLPRALVATRSPQCCWCVRLHGRTHPYREQTRHQVRCTAWLGPCR